MNDEDWDQVDLTAVHERIEWAGRHVGRLRKLVDGYVASRPFHVLLSKSSDGATITETTFLTADPPMPISLVLGDVAHHLRAALDNLVGILRPDGPTRSTAFPIAASPQIFNRLAKQMLSGVPAWGVEAIRTLQPFSQESGSLGRDLDVIDQMAQRDRHRALLIHAPLIETDSVHFPDPTTDRSAPIDRRTRDDGVVEVRYPTGALVRSEYQVRVVVDEDIPGVHGQEVIHLAQRWLDTLRTVLSHTEDAADQAWRQSNARGR